MPLWNCVRIIPVLEKPAWEAATATTTPLDADGLSGTVPVYSASEPTPRTTITHYMGSASPNAPQLALLQSTWGVDANGYVIPPAGCEGVLSKVHDRLTSLPSVVATQMLSEHGLTQNANV